MPLYASRDIMTNYIFAMYASRDIMTIIFCQCRLSEICEICTFHLLSLCTWLRRDRDNYVNVHPERVKSQYRGKYEIEADTEFVRLCRAQVYNFARERAFLSDLLCDKRHLINGNV